MRHRATVAARVFEKVRECHFFLVLMTQHEDADDPERFLFCVSAFLCSFRSIAYKLYGVVEARDGKSAMRALETKLDSNRDINFLRNSRDLEVHGNSVKLWQRFRVSVSDSMRGSRGSYTSQSVDWEFSLYPNRNLIELCLSALAQMECVVREAQIDEQAKG